MNRIIIGLLALALGLSIGVAVYETVAQSGYGSLPVPSQNEACPYRDRMTGEPHAVWSLRQREQQGCVRYYHAIERRFRALEADKAALEARVAELEARPMPTAAPPVVATSPPVRVTTPAPTATPSPTPPVAIEGAPAPPVSATAASTPSATPTPTAVRGTCAWSKGTWTFAPSGSAEFDAAWRGAPSHSGGTELTETGHPVYVVVHAPGGVCYRSYIDEVNDPTW